MREITNFRPGGAKSKKLATKRTTLFGLPAGNATKKSSKESKENTQVQTETQDTQDTLTNGESQELGQEVSMVDEEVRTCFRLDSILRHQLVNVHCLRLSNPISKMSQT